MLGAGESKLLKALDLAVGGILLGASGVPNVLSWFDAKNEFTRISAALVQKFETVRVGSGRTGESEKIQAAHAVLVLSAFVDEISELNLPFNSKDLQLTKRDAVRIGGGEVALNARSVDFVRDLLTTEVPLPSPIEDRSQFTERLQEFYTTAAERLMELIKGLSLWDTLNSGLRDDANVRISRLPFLARHRYDDYFVRLASLSPELNCWANLQLHDVTQAKLSTIALSLKRVEALLREKPMARLSEQWAGIARANRAHLQSTIADNSDEFGLPNLPTLGDSYVDPKFRVISSTGAESIAQHSFWERQLVREDLGDLLVGLLVHRSTLECPILVLGDPGSGKSALTKALASRLPPSRFIAVRVPLREVPADAEIQDQIEIAIRQETGSSVHWDELSANTGDAIPLLMFDGFDELLQATGVGHTDYLMRIAELQRREMVQGRPTAAMVTSRVTVADRARLPKGSIVLRLDPFDDQQISQWISVWNLSNADYFASKCLNSLSLERVSSYMDLAQQPLLLLILALYDADANGLTSNSGPMKEAALFEALLQQFARREVNKTGTHLPRDVIERQVEGELTQLSVVALAMFNRGLQLASDREIERDLSALISGGVSGQNPGRRFRQPLTRAEMALGRFFFVQKSSATSSDRVLTTYEFLHAKFGEYLVARLIWGHIRRVLLLTSQSCEMAWHDSIESDGQLYKILTHSAISIRTPILSFLKEIISSDSDGEKFVGVLQGVFKNSSDRIGEPPLDGYLPRDSTPVRRQAVYSANLTLLILACSVSELDVRNLFQCDHEQAISLWRRQSLLWKSQMTEEEYASFIGAFSVTWRSDGHDTPRVPILELFPDRSHRVVDEFDSLTYPITHDDDPGVFESEWLFDRDNQSEFVIANAQLLCDPSTDHLLQGVGPLMASLGPLAGVRLSSGSSSRGLMRFVMDILMSPTRPLPERIGAYERMIDVLDALDRDPPRNIYGAMHRAKALLFSVMRSDDEAPPEVISRVLPYRITGDLIPAGVRLYLAKLGLSDTLDRLLLERLAEVFNSGSVGKQLHLEAWVVLAELDYLEGNDWAWSDAPLRAIKGLNIDAGSRPRPHRGWERRLRALAQMRSGAKSRDEVTECHRDPL